MRAEFVIRMRGSLFNKLWTPTPKAEKPNPTRRGSPAPKYPDNVVLEIRRLREEFGMTFRAISQRLSVDFNIDINSQAIDRFCQYTTRAHLVPEPGRTTPYINVE